MSGRSLFKEYQSAIAGFGIGIPALGLSAFEIYIQVDQIRRHGGPDYMAPVTPLLAWIAIVVSIAMALFLNARSVIHYRNEKIRLGSDLEELHKRKEKEHAEAITQAKMQAIEEYLAKQTERNAKPLKNIGEFAAYSAVKDSINQLNYCQRVGLRVLCIGAKSEFDFTNHMSSLGFRQIMESIVRPLRESSLVLYSPPRPPEETEDGVGVGDGTILSRLEIDSAKAKYVWEVLEEPEYRIY
ncbi:MAG: hypothetical protein ACLQU1_33270 [Bryobacteraceae bacterium]